jgi:hypothetical protein
MNFDITTNEGVFHNRVGDHRAIIDNAIADDATLDGAIGADGCMWSDDGVLNSGSRMDEAR